MPLLDLRPPSPTPSWPALASTAGSPVLDRSHWQCRLCLVSFCKHLNASSAKKSSGFAVCGACGQKNTWVCRCQRSTLQPGILASASSSLATIACTSHRATESLDSGSHKGGSRVSNPYPAHCRSSPPKTRDTPQSIGTRLTASRSRPCVTKKAGSCDSAPPLRSTDCAEGPRRVHVYPPVFSRMTGSRPATLRFVGYGFTCLTISSL